MSLTVAMGDICLSYHRHGHCSLFGVTACCREYSVEHQMCINTQLKLVPNKYTIYSCLSDVC